jgi:pimeloyl-ACP methyl ester carboxylesterase
MVAMKLLSPNPPNDQLPLFVFLPGMDGSGQLLHRQLEGLGKRFDVRCLALPVDDVSEWDRLVEQVTQLITQEMAKETAQERSQKQKNSLRPIYLCGESFGGCLALKLAAYRPKLFQRLILINPASSFSRLPWLYWGSSFADWLPTPLFHLSAMGLVPFLVDPERVLSADCDALLRVMQAVTPQAAAWRLRLLRHFRIDSIDLFRLHMPVLLVAGDCDRLLPSSQEIRQIAQQLPMAQTHFLAKSGHACLLEQEVNLGEILQQYESRIAEVV